MTTDNTFRDDAPALYVGTYGKYINDSLFGAWLYLEDYEDAEAFLNACAELHKDEPEEARELMFQDFQNFPASLYHESMGENAIQQIYDWMELDEDEQEILEAYEDNYGAGDGDISDRVQTATDAFFCKLKPYMLKWNFWPGEEWKAFGYYMEDAGMIEIPDHIRDFFDFEAYGKSFQCEYSIVGEERIVFSDR